MSRVTLVNRVGQVPGALFRHGGGGQHFSEELSWRVPVVQCALPRVR